MAELLAQGFNVFQAVADTQGIDCGVLSPGGQFYPIHIMSRAEFSQGKWVSIWSFPPGDMFVIIYDERTKGFWIIPSRDYKEMSTHWTKKDGTVYFRLRYTRKNAAGLEGFKGQKGVDLLRCHVERASGP
ncbi:MAG: hypothetical protein Q8P22_05945 [Chloroflexota bacterium]|nr:hypothetical protein [Chloroflexota bacterium]